MEGKIPFTEILGGIEQLTEMTPGSLSADELASFVGNEPYPTCAYAEISLGDLITMIWDQSKKLQT